MRSVVVFAVLALAAALFIPRYASSIHSGQPAPTMMAARPVAPVAAPTPADSGSVIVPRGANGHFQVEARVEGRRLNFMVDTGASVIALTASDAATLGLHPAEHEFTAVVSTANGTVRAAPVELNMVEIDDLVVRNVAALVMPEGVLANNLLGMSFLSRLRRFEIANGKLVLEQ